MDYIATVNFKGVKSLLVRNCKSKAEAIRKLEDGSHPDVSGLDVNISEFAWRSAKLEKGEK